VSFRKWTSIAEGIEEIRTRGDTVESQPTPPQPTMTKVYYVASAAAVTVGLVALAAWWSRNLIFASVSPDYVPMTLSIALSVVLLACALLLRTDSLRTPWHDKIPTALATAVLMISCWVVFEFAFNTGFDIDRLLGAGRGTVEGYVLAQPSPISTITLLAASLGTILLLNEGLVRERRGVVISAISLFMISAGTVITLGYAYGSPLLYGGDLRPVSLLSGVSYALLGTAIICLLGPDHWPMSAFVGPSVRARLLRSFVPLVVFLVLVSGSLSNRALSSSSNPALTASLIALLTAFVVGYLVSRLSGRIGERIDSANAELLRTQEELRRANEKLNVLGSITRHDALNRLAVVLGRLQLLEGMSKEKAVLRQVDESLIAARAIEKMMQFTGEYQKIGVSGPVWIDVEDAFREALRGVDHEKISVSSEVSGLEILADRMFEKVLTNLVDNSLRHGKDLKNLKLHHQRNEHDMVLVYEDDGGGLTAEDKANLFKRGHGKHTGLGMFLSKEILEFSGMSVLETGTTGEGARFEIRVPPDKYRLKER